MPRQEITRMNNDEADDSSSEIRALLSLLTSKKDDNCCLRVCIHALNKSTIKCKFLIPRFHDILGTMAGFTIFSKSDMKSGYS